MYFSVVKLRVSNLTCFFPGDRVLSGDARLSLTSQYIVILNEGFTHIQDVDFQMSFEALPANGFSGPVMEQLHFLYDLIQKTPSLKVRFYHDTKSLKYRQNIFLFV